MVAAATSTKSNSKKVKKQKEWEKVTKSNSKKVKKQKEWEKITKSNSKKVKKQKKWEKATPEEHVCAEYCDLYFGAMKRCPYPHHSEALAEADSCVQGCIDASFSKYGTAQDFLLKDTVQCRMNHAKMGIKEGPLANSNHCLHASLEGPEKCTSDTVAMTEAATLAAGKIYFYDPSSSLQTAGHDMSKILLLYISSHHSPTGIAWMSVRGLSRL